MKVRLAVMAAAVAALAAMPAVAYGNGDDGCNGNGGGTAPAPDGGAAAVGNQDNDVVLDCVGSGVIVGDDNSVNTNANVNNNSQTVNVGGGGAVTSTVPVDYVHRGVRQGRVFFVRNVPLARTGFDAWMIALLGGASLAGGLALQRRARASR